MAIMRASRPKANGLGAEGISAAFFTMITRTGQTSRISCFSGDDAQGLAELLQQHQLFARGLFARRC